MRFTILASLATLSVSILGAAIPSPLEPAGGTLARDAGIGGASTTDGRGGYNKRHVVSLRDAGVGGVLSTDGRGDYNRERRRLCNKLRLPESV